MVSLGVIELKVTVQASHPLPANLGQYTNIMSSHVKRILFCCTVSSYYITISLPITSSTLLKVSVMTSSIIADLNAFRISG